MIADELPEEAAGNFPMTPEVFDTTMSEYERRSREEGGGAYAVAFALLQLRQEQARQTAEFARGIEQIAEAVGRLGDILA
jgi:hypothetical protein